MNINDENDGVPNDAPSPEVSIEEFVDVAMDNNGSVSSIYHPAHTDSFASNLSEDRGYNMSGNSSYTSVVSGLDNDKSILQHELLKCQGLTVQLEFSEDFDGDQDDLDVVSPFEMDILWANPMYLQTDLEGKQQIFIPTDLSLDSADEFIELGENPLKKKLKRRKMRKVSKSSSEDGSSENLQTLEATNSEGRSSTKAMAVSSASAYEDCSYVNMSGSDEAHEDGSSTDNEAAVEASNASSRMVTASASSAEGEDSGAATTESDGSEYDVDYMGRWDIFWPIMSKSERRMVGAPSEIEINDIDSRSFVVSPTEMDEDCQRMTEETNPRHDVEIQEIVEEPPGVAYIETANRGIDADPPAIAAPPSDNPGAECMLELRFVCRI